MRLLLLFLLVVSGEERVELPAVDFIVVGAGAAGSVVASELSAWSRVLVLEAGPSDAAMSRAIHTPLQAGQVWGSPLNWNYSTVRRSGLKTPQGEDRGDVWPRGKTWGGSTSINAMLYVRGRPSDYDGWARETGDSSWAWSNVLPLFLRMENSSAYPESPLWHGTSGPMHVSHTFAPFNITRAALHASSSVLGVPEGADYNAEEQRAASLLQLNQLRGRRWSAADGYLKPALARETTWAPPGDPAGDSLGLDVESGSRVVRVLFDESKRAYGVEYRSSYTDTVYVRNVTKEVILCAGAIGSPHILMLSGVGDEQMLERAGVSTVVPQPAVGQNLMDHLIFPVSVFTPQATQLTEARPSAGGGGVFYRDIQISVQADIWDGTVELQEGDNVFTMGPCLNTPKSVGFIELVSSDYTVPPAIHPQYFSDPSDLSRMTQALEDTLQVLRKMGPEYVSRVALLDGSQPWGDCSTQKQRETYVLAKSHTSYHPCGTCAMGSVVDTAFRVVGTTGLRVIDASVMPRITTGNTGTPTMLIGLKGAAKIRRDHMRAKK